MSRRQVVALLTVCVCAITSSVGAQIPGQNVNMVSGTEWPGGDPFLQRQNEPSIAVSSRNPLHLLAGANDYRTVDLPGLPDTGEEEPVGDAWLGLFKSSNGGLTWRSTLVPGYPQDQSPAGLNSPLKGFQAGADPVVRAGTHGLFYYGGLAFNRGDKGRGVIFVARYIDRNNKENGDATAYLGTTVVTRGTAGQFVDKPAMAVGLPDAASGVCVVDGQRIASGPVYVAWSTFVGHQPPTSERGNDNNLVRSKLFIARSNDCGVSFGKPVLLSEGSHSVQSTSIAIDPRNGTVYVAWRQFLSNSQGNTILVAKSTTGGKSFSKGAPVLGSFASFDQPTTGTTFRTNSYPTITVDDTGRLYVAWAARGFAPGNIDPVHGDARIVLSTSRDGVRFTVPRAIDNPVDAQGTPLPGHQVMPALLYAGGRLQVLYYDLREDVSGFFERFVDEFSIFRVTPPLPRRRHTLDVRTAQALPADAPDFSSYAVNDDRPSARASQYMIGSRPGLGVLEQLQFNPPNLPLYALGELPFMGDYIDLAARMFMPDIGPDGQERWRFNGQGGEAVFHLTWTDNRDVRPPVAPRTWADYTPPQVTISNTPSRFDPSQNVPACVPGQAGMRNANIYTSRVTPGLVAGSPGNSKPLSLDLPRTFVVFASNTTADVAAYRFTIANQPAGGSASFLQFGSLTHVDVLIAPKSSVARTVYVTSTNADAPVRVDIVQIAAPDAAPLPDGLNATVILNPDITNPDITNPDITNPDITNIEVANPDITNPDITNPDITNPDITNPDITNPDITNPDITNGSVTDYTYRVTNNGNTTSQYNLNLATATGDEPDGFKIQLVVHRQYQTPVAEGCNLKQQTQNQILANVIRPEFVSIADLGQPQVANPALGNVTFWLEPGESVVVTIRVVDPDRNDGINFDPTQALAVAIAAAAVNSDDAANGVVTPEFDVVLPPPFATDDEATTTVQTPVRMNVLANDANLNGLTKVHSFHPAGMATNSSATNEVVVMPTTGLVYAGGQRMGVIDQDLNALVGRLPAPEAASPGSFLFGRASETGISYWRYASGGPESGPGMASMAMLVAIDGRPESPTFHQYLSLPALSGRLVTFAIDTQRRILFALHGGESPLAYSLTAIDINPSSESFHHELGSLPLPPDARARGIAVNGLTQKIYIGADGAAGGVYVLALDEEPVELTRIAGTDAALSVVVDDFENMVYAWGITNTLRVNAIDGGSDALIAQIPTAEANRFVSVNERVAVHRPFGLVFFRTRDNIVVVSSKRTSPAFNTVLQVYPAGRELADSDVQVDEAANRLVSVAGFDQAATIFTLAEAVNPIESSVAIRTPRNPNDVAIDVIRHRAFVSVGLGLVQHVDLVSRALAGQVSTFIESAGVFVNPVAHRAYIGFTGERTGLKTFTADGLQGEVTGFAHGAGRLTFGARDAATNRFFIVNGTNPAGTNVGVPGSLVVVDGATNAVVRTVETANSPFGAGLNQATGKLYIAGQAIAGIPGQVVVHDINNLDAGYVTANVSAVPVLPNEAVSFGRHVVVNPATGKVYMLMGGGSTASIAVLDPATNIVTPLDGIEGLPLAAGGTGTANGRADIIRVYPGLNRVYVGMRNPTTGETRIFALDGTTHAIVGSFFGGGGSNTHTASYIAVNEPSNRVYIADFNANRVTVHDAADLETLASTDVAAGPSALAYNTLGKRLYVSSLSAKTITALAAGSLAHISSVRLPLVAQFLGVDETRGVIYTSGGDASDEAGAMVILDSGESLGQDLEVTGVSMPAHGTAEINLDSSVTYTPEPGFFGTDSFTYSVEASNGTATGTVTVTVTAARQMPTAFSDVYAVNGTVEIAAPGVLANDVVPAGATAQLITPPAHASLFTLNPDGSFTYTPQAEFFGIDTFAYAAASAGPTSNVATVTLAIEPPVTFVVVNTNDSGFGSLRQAILNSNSHQGRDTITFDIPGEGPVWTIDLLSALPPTTDPVIIEGSPQQGEGTAPVIELNGAGAGPEAAGLRVRGGHSIVRNLIVNRFSGTGIVIESDDNVISQVYSGTDAAGVSAQGNGRDGLTVIAANGNSVTDSVLSGNAGFGLVLLGASSNNTIAGNRIGTNRLGTAAVGNLMTGIGLFPDVPFAGAAPGNNVIDGNVSSGNAGNGLTITGLNARGNVVTGNRFGTDSTGTVVIANGAEGIFLNGGASANRIGGVDPRERNIISGNGHSGVFLDGSGVPTAGNEIVGNFIGTDATGTLDFGNSRNGVHIVDGPDNRVGSDVPAGRNVISGNSGEGVRIDGANATNNTVVGNYIGTDVTGAADLGNSASGVFIRRAPANVVTGNVVSGNDGFAGVAICGNASFCGGGDIGNQSNNAGGNIVRANRVGTDVTGMLPLGNNGHGVSIDGAPNTLIGGAGAGNVISGNSLGLIIFGPGSSGNRVQGNYVGLDANGLLPIGNSQVGVLVEGADNLIGGTTPAERNVIAASGFSGIEIRNRNRIVGNYIGTDRLGTTAQPNNGGIFTNGNVAGAMIGGAEPGEGNLISGNNGFGINACCEGDSGLTVQGNLIGTTPDGAGALGNDGGILLNTGANQVGGLTSAARNVIAANRGSGVFVLGASANGNKVQGNYIGVDPTGMTGLGNRNSGVMLDGASDNVIGGDQPGAGNVIAGNGAGPEDFGNGVAIFEFRGPAQRNVIQGNRIGVNAAGTGAIANFGDGITIRDADDTVIGGTTPAARNLIAGNAFSGISLFGTASRTSIRGNWMGLDAGGTTAIPNSHNGVLLYFGPFDNTIGGVEEGAGNVISGNQFGISFQSASNNVVLGNLIGTDPTGTIDVGNATHGINLSDGAAENRIGDGTAAGRNVIAGNDGNGILILAGSAGNVVHGNYIGVAADGSAPMPSGNNGVFIAESSGNTIRDNVIANAIFSSIVVLTGVDNTLAGNSLRAPGFHAIELGVDGITPNDPGDADEGPNHLQNYPVVDQALESLGTVTVNGTIDTTPGERVRLEFFLTSGGCNPELRTADRFLGTTEIVAGVGPTEFSLTYAAESATGMGVTATATVGGNTSELSACAPVLPALSPN